VLAIRRASALLLAFVATANAQQPSKPTLSLDEAISLARRNNPGFLSTKNDADVADWTVKQAYGALLPGASASTAFQYQAAGKPRLGALTFESIPEAYVSNYYIGVNYSLSGASLLAPGQAKSARSATAATINAADFTLVGTVKRQYLSVLRAQDGVTLAKLELDRAGENRKLAEARVRVGAATPIEQKQAEVEAGRAQVALLQAENMVRTERLRLMENIGLDVNADVELTTRFEVSELPWSQDDLIKLAMESHPNLVAARAGEQASNATVKMAKTAYLPSLSFSAGISGFARETGSSAYLIDQARNALTDARAECEFRNAVAAGRVAGYPLTCPSAVLTPDMERSIISGNNVFPFSYTREPTSAALQISLPIFTGFTRELEIERAKAGAADARYRTRGEELRLRTDVATAYLNAKTAKETVALEVRNKDLAEDQLKLARERYRLGAASFFELQDAATIKARADRAYLISVYTFHESMAALEVAVGRSLR
jgi:outer membrane protein